MESSAAAAVATAVFSLVAFNAQADTVRKRDPIGGRSFSIPLLFGPVPPSTKGPIGGLQHHTMMITSSDGSPLVVVRPETVTPQDHAHSTVVDATAAPPPTRAPVAAAAVVPAMPNPTVRLQRLPQSRRPLRHPYDWQWLFGRHYTRSRGTGGYMPTDDMKLSQPIKLVTAMSMATAPAAATKPVFTICSFVVLVGMLGTGYHAV